MWTQNRNTSRRCDDLIHLHIIVIKYLQVNTGGGEIASTTSTLLLLLLFLYFKQFILTKKIQLQSFLHTSWQVMQKT